MDGPRLWSDHGRGLGELYDRAANGYVVDFILLHYQQHIFPAFNVADSALFCGVVIWIGPDDSGESLGDGKPMSRDSDRGHAPPLWLDTG